MYTATTTTLGLSVVGTVLCMKVYLSSIDRAKCAELSNTTFEYMSGWGWEEVGKVIDFQRSSSPVLSI